MLEGLASWFLKTYIGKYVNVNPEKLSIGLLSGVVELENASLKLDAFNDEAWSSLPFELKYGHIGKIKLNVSLNTLRASPWSLIAENVQIIVGPRRETTPNKTTDDEQREKLDRLVNMDNKWFKEVELLGLDEELLNGGNRQTSSRFWSSMVAPVAYSLLNNLQVSLKNLHIRYEDDVNAFSVGANIESILIKNDPQPAESDNASTKLFELINFSLYTHPIVLFVDSATDDLVEKMNFPRLGSVDFLIQPTSFSAQLTRDLSLKPLRKRKKPRIRIKTVLDEFNVHLNLTQINYFTQMGRSMFIFDNVSQARARGIHRPAVDGAGENRNRLLWRYAYDCVRVHLKRPNWRDFKNWSRDVNIYHRTHVKALMGRLSEASEAVAEDDAEKARIEREWNFKQLVALRRAIFEKFITKPEYKAYLDKIHSQPTTNGGNSTGVYGYLSWRLTSLKDYYLWRQKPIEPAPLPLPQPVNEHNQIDDEVIGLINDTIENDTLFKRDSLLAVLEFKLQNASIVLSSTTDNELIKIKLENSLLTLEALPRHDSFLVEVNLGSFFLFDRTSHSKGTIFPTLVAPSSSSNDTFSLVYEHKPLNKQLKTNSSLTVKSCGLDIVYSQEVVAALFDFSRTCGEYWQNACDVRFSLNELDYVHTGVGSSSSTSMVTLAPPVKSFMHTIDFDLEIYAPKLIIPHNYLSKSPYVFIFDFGRLTFVNRRQDKVQQDKTIAADQRRPSDYASLNTAGADANDSDADDVFATPMATPPNEYEPSKAIVTTTTHNNITAPSMIASFSRTPAGSFNNLRANFLYSNFDLNLTELQVICGKYSDDNLRFFISKGHSHFHLLEKFNIRVEVALCKLNFQEDESPPMVDWPPVKVSIHVDLLKLNIDDLKLINLSRMIDNVKGVLGNSGKSNKSTSKAPAPNFKLKLAGSSSISFIVVDLNLEEIDLTLSITDPDSHTRLEHQTDLTQVSHQTTSALKSICELKLYSINCLIALNQKLDVKFNLSLFNMLLIDARQIYGRDYQLLAASHSSVLLDANTGGLVNNRLELLGNGANQPQQEQKPLINIDLLMSHDHELIVDSTFSTLDVVLNPETISELVIFAYTIYLNLSKPTPIVPAEPVLTPVEETAPSHVKTSINFKFNRLSVLMFRIEDEVAGKARKVALLALEGVSINSTLVPKLGQLDVLCKIDGLNVSDLSSSSSLKNNNFVFRVGVQDNGQSKIFEFNFKKSHESREVDVKIASLCYLHSPKLIHDIQRCLQDFVRFHAKIMQEVTDKASAIARNMLQKGKLYLKNTLAELYNTTDQPPVEQRPVTPSIKISLLLETPIISIPINLNCRNFLVAHLGQIRICNDDGSNGTGASSSQFKIFLKDMNLFSVDAKLEHESHLDATSKSNEDSFYIFYKPTRHQRLIDNTDVNIGVDYVPEFSPRGETKKNLHGGCLNLVAKIINTCRITLSKMNIEQLIQAMDNIVYVEKKQPPSSANGTAVRMASLPIRMEHRSRHSTTSVSFSRKSFSTKDELDFDDFENRFFLDKQSSDESSSGSCSESWPDEKQAEQDDAESLDLNIETLFKMEKLEISFLAEVERPLEEIAELVFNEYELRIGKHEPKLTSVQMSLKSLYLVDKLETSRQTNIGECCYLLWTNANSGEKHTCKNLKRNYLNENLSLSTPCVTNATMSSCYYHVKSKPHKIPASSSKKNTDIIHNMFELTQFYNQLSTSLPSQLPESGRKKSIRKVKTDKSMRNANGSSGNKAQAESNGHGEVNVNVCPSTPPPSPTGEKKMFFARCESERNLAAEPEQSATDQNTNSIKHKPQPQQQQQQQHQCKVCLNESLPLVKIDLHMVDDSHPDFNGRYNGIHRHLNIKFSRLKLNLNPETWIILLDLLGLGSKVYPVIEPFEQVNSLLDGSSRHENDGDDATEIDPESKTDKKQHTSVKFQVEQFTIQLNESESSSRQHSKLKINNVKAYIESRVEYVKAKGKLGSLAIYDMSDHRGLYTDRFLTSGNRALEFEFFKYIGPLEINDQIHDFEMMLRLKTSSFKYVHTQRFIVSITNYFQQFNQLQDALGKMRALSLGEKVSYEAQRSSRIQLDIKIETPIIVIPLNSQSKEVLVFNLGNIDIKNRFSISTDASDFNRNLANLYERMPNANVSICLNDQNGANGSDVQKDCLLDLIDVKFTDTHIYSAMRYERHGDSNIGDDDDDDDNNSTEDLFGYERSPLKGPTMVKFQSFYFKQNSMDILKRQQNVIQFSLEHNLESELSHKSPDWSIYSKFSSLSLNVDLQQYKLIRGILDQNVGEKITVETRTNSNFIITNPKIETVLTGRVWKVININFDLDNVYIQLFKDEEPDELDLSRNSISGPRSAPLACMSFIKSLLIYESYSDQSKLVDLVSNEINITDMRPNRAAASNGGTNFNVLYKKQQADDLSHGTDSGAGTKRKRLQLEIHFRSNRTTNRYSILFNNCCVISLADWLMQMKNFLGSNAPPAPESQPAPSATVQDKSPAGGLPLKSAKATLGSPSLSVMTPDQLPTQVKINLTNTDFVLIENRDNLNSQAIILRLTAFFEYNECKVDRPVECCLQSVQLFSCQMNAIEETALSIIDPVTFNINVNQKLATGLYAGVINTNCDYTLDISTDLFRLRFSYLDFNLFVKVIESIKTQIQQQQRREQNSLGASPPPLSSSSPIDKSFPTSSTASSVLNDDQNNALATTGKFSLHLVDMNMWMGNFCFCIIDDCNDIDIPLVDLQFNRFNLVYTFAAAATATAASTSHGSAEFALNIDYYNRLLSGWEPLVEPWLARVDWKYKPTKNIYTLTSMDVLNVNLTNTFMNLIVDVVNMWKSDFDANGPAPKRHNQFQPYKLVNLTGQPIKLALFEDTSAGAEWIVVDDKCEKQFSFVANQNHSSHRSHLQYNPQQRHKLAQNRLRVKLDNWSEIRPLTIDKVGTYFRHMYTESISSSTPSSTRLIFEISLSGNATKLIEIKSPVSIKNRLNLKLQCRIESCIQAMSSKLGPLIIEIDMGQEVSVPIKYLPCTMWFRPVETDDHQRESEFSANCLNLSQLGHQSPGHVEYYQLTCRLCSLTESFMKPVTSSIVDHDELFYFFAKIKRYQFPNTTSTAGEHIGHLIYIEPAFALYNLLPVEFRYKFLSNRTVSGKKTHEQVINGKIDAYKMEYFNSINVSRPVDVLVDIDNFRLQRAIEINPHKHLMNLNKGGESDEQMAQQQGAAGLASSQQVSSELQQQSNSKQAVQASSASLSNRKLTILRRVNFYDERRRPLFLIARITYKIGSGLLKSRLSTSQQNGKHSSDSSSSPVMSQSINPCPIVVQIAAIYCFFNLTGLPLIFRQYNCDEAAGQLDEHEIACSNQPLLFSFNEIDSPYACSMRMGKLCNEYKSTGSISRDDTKTIIAKWCKPFGLDSGSSFRALHVVNNSLSMSDESASSGGAGADLDGDADDASANRSSYINHDWVYYIGIEIKPGKGLLKDTTFVYFSTRYYLLNKTGKDLLLSQYYFVKNSREKSVAGTTWAPTHARKSSLSSQIDNHSLVLLKDSMTQFHWPRSDFDQLLSVRLKNELNFNWSGGFKIDEVNSFYINLRNTHNTSEFFYLKVEICLDGGTFYILFSEKLDIPYPLRVENYSQVPVYIYQSASLEENCYITVKPRQVFNYSWDEPISERKLAVGVRGGTNTIFDATSSGDEQRKYLYYENFIYIVFTEKANDTTATPANSSWLTSRQLVLAYQRNKIFIDEKEPGNRAQLWSLTTDGYLVHEGSSAPRELDHDPNNVDLSTRYVLDIEDMAPRPNHLIPLTLRKIDLRRKNTQKWNFDRQGMLCCNVRNMCLQVYGEFKRYAGVVLGPTSDYQVKIGLVKTNPIMNVHKEQLRPGSGHLLLNVLSDGPTRLLRLTNIKDKSYLSINWERAEHNNSNTNDLNDSLTDRDTRKSIEVYVNLTGGIGVSLVQWLNQEYEELIYAFLKSFELNFEQNRHEQKLLLDIQTIQVCNQLINAFRQNLIVIQPSSSPNSSSSSSSSSSSRSNMITSKDSAALKIDYLRKFRHNETQIYIENLSVVVADVNLQIEERLLWKIIQFFGIGNLESNSDVNLTEEKFQKTGLKKREDENGPASAATNNNNNHNNGDSTSNVLRSDIEANSSSLAGNYYKNQINSILIDSSASKYIFNRLQINGIYMTLSVYKTSRMTSDLLRIKSSLGIPLIQFESARIECKPFILMNEHDTAMCILDLIGKHYKQELRSNAIRILGSVDFLGNPLGLMVDFKESFSNVLSNGQVTDFVFSITHGVANSLSKVSGSLSDELNELTMDERHRETREQIRNIYNNGSIDHFLGGALGFAVGIVGGAMSLATQTYRGFNESGVRGAFTGLGKGAVGTVSKPIVGMLDFANGIASAIRETSKTTYKMEVARVRETRCCSTSGALLSSFSRSDANGQKILYQVNNNNLAEKYIALEQLKSVHSTSDHHTQVEQTLSLVTNQRVIFVKSLEYEFRPIYEVLYQQLKGMSVIDEKDFTYLEMYIETDEGEKIFPRFKFETGDSARSLEKKIRYAKADYDEKLYTLHYYKDDEN